MAQIWMTLADQVGKAGGVLPNFPRSEETLTEGAKRP
jgi:hypothetical protein